MIFIDKKLYGCVDHFRRACLWKNDFKDSTGFFITLCMLELPRHVVLLVLLTSSFLRSVSSVFFIFEEGFFSLFYFIFFRWHTKGIYDGYYKNITPKRSAEIISSLIFDLYSLYVYLLDRVIRYHTYLVTERFNPIKYGYHLLHKTL